ncbi:hypothetical protein BDV18DRAFT_130024 [Aspergillus unguis]
MRTRSQPDSPGGLVSLEDMQSTTRRTRSTRSASRAASQEPSSQQSAEPATQAPTRSKSQQRTTKKTTTKKATTAKTASTKSTSKASSAKPQTRTSSRRGTRSATRKAGRDASEEVHESIEQNNHDTARPEDDNNTELNTEKAVTGASKSDAALMEHKATELNRKRPRAESPVEENAEPATPNVNKRRNTGPAGSTPFALRHTSLTRRLARIAPRDQRLARRAAESQGRIHSTIFRLPAFVAQAEADRRASEAAALTAPPHSEPLNTELPLSYQQDQADEQVADEEPVAAPETSTPQTPRRGWNITGIFNSVPRSFSRFFSRSPARSEAPAIQQPATEYIRRTRPLDEAFPPADSEEASNRGRRLSEQPPAKRPRNLSYSLFPPKIDRSLYLPPEDTTTPAKTPAEAPAEASAPADSTAHQPVQDMPQRTQSQTPSETTERGISHASSIGGQPQKKKRKRSPSPDVIPNPPGCSYGLHPDYFYYSSDESDEEEEEIPAPQTEPRNTLSRTALRSAVQTERPASKKVRFDASPDDTPSKLRARDLPRATDPYTGRHFIGMGSPQPASAPTTPTPERQLTPDEAHAQMRARPGFRPNLSGTFQLDYDAFSDDSDSSGSESPTSIPAPSPLTSTITPSASERYDSAFPHFESKILIALSVPNHRPLALLHLLHSLHSPYKLRRPRPRSTKKLSPGPVLKPRNTNPRRLVDSALLVAIRAL